MTQERPPKRRGRFSDRMGLAAWSALLTFFNLMSATVAGVLEPFRLSNDELLVLICLAHAGDALSMGEIGRATLLQAGRLRLVVDRLEERRLIAWRRSRTDRRKVLVRMTSGGRQLMERLSPVMFELVRRLAEPLGQESTEFIRAKMRKIVSGATADPAGMYRYDGAFPLAADMTTEPAGRSGQRPPTWGLAGWLRCCQWSAHADRIWRRKFRNLGLTAPKLQVLAALSGAAEGMAVDAVASATGLPQVTLTSTLSALEQVGLITRPVDEARPRARLAKLTARGEQKVLQALPVANSFADDLYQGLSDEDLEHVLSLIPSGCSAAWQVRHDYHVSRRLTSTPSAQ